MTELPLERQREAYGEDGYVPLPGLFPPEVMRAFYDRLFADLDLGRRKQEFAVQGPLLSKAAIEVYSHIYPPMATFLWGLTPRIAEVAQKRLVPTYAYFRMYQLGDVCRVHSDRHACEHSLSLMVGLSDDVPWALSVERRRLDAPTPVVEESFGDQQFASVPMTVGDGIMYQGVHHRHGRIEPNPNRWSAHLFMHWVDIEGPYGDQAFDRPMVEAAGNQAS